MESLYMLKKIYIKPELYLWDITLTNLSSFLTGYEFGKNTLDDHLPNDTSMAESKFFYEFNEYVHNYYGCTVSTMSAEYLITERSGTDNEAFYKYYELLDSFMKQEGHQFL